MQKYFLNKIVIFTCIFTFSLAARSGDCPEFPYFKPETGPLAKINCQFHHGYESEVEKVVATFGAPEGIPVLLNLGGNLKFKYNGTEYSHKVTTEEYHQVKAFSHAFFATYIVLQKINNVLDNETKTKLSAIKTELLASIKLIDDFQLSFKDKVFLKLYSNKVVKFINTTLSDGEYGSISLVEFLDDTLPLVEKANEISARIELTNLNNKVNEWLAYLTDSDKAKLQILVATAHQARADEITVLYFKQKFNFSVGEGAALEDGLVVMEDKFSEAAAIKLLARHILDRKISQDIFNDPVRLQADLLAPAAKKLLATDLLK